MSTQVFTFWQESGPESPCQFCGESAVLSPVETKVGVKLLCEFCAIGEQLDRVLDADINRPEEP